MQSSKMSPAHFVWLIATALIVTSVPLDTTALIVFYYTLNILDIGLIYMIFKCQLDFNSMPSSSRIRAVIFVHEP
jgi:hypothetical protein